MDFEAVYFILMSLAALAEVIFLLFFTIVIWRLYRSAQKVHQQVTETIGRGAEYARETKESLGRMITVIVDFFAYKITRRKRRYR